MKRYGAPRTVVTDRLRSYCAAMKEIGNFDRQEVGRHLSNSAENSLLPFRRRSEQCLDSGGCRTFRNSLRRMPHFTTTSISTATSSAARRLNQTATQPSSNGVNFWLDRAGRV
nr:hypothetical protein [Henriciella algicola]